MYDLINASDNKRIYKSSITGTEVSTKLIHTDEGGGKWWAFEDLLNMPFIRKKAAESVTQLYGAGVTKDDLTSFVNKTKEILKSTDADKYEKAYSEVLQLEAITNQIADPVRQSLSLCTVYILADDEQIDTFTTAKAGEKMSAWTLQPELQAFFLNWLTDGMNAYTTLYGNITQIVLSQEK